MSDKKFCQGRVVIDIKMQNRSIFNVIAGNVDIGLLQTGL